MRAGMAVRWGEMILLAAVLLAPSAVAAPGGLASGGAEDGAVPWILGVACDLLPTC